MIRSVRTKDKISDEEQLCFMKMKTSETGKFQSFYVVVKFRGKFRRVKCDKHGI